MVGANNGLLIIWVKKIHLQDHWLKTVGFLCLRFYAPEALCFRVVRPSVRPKPEIPSFDLYLGPLVHPTNRKRFTAFPSVCPSVRPDRFPGICRRTHGGNGLKFYMLMYLYHLQNWLDYGYSLLIFLRLTPLCLNETGQIWGVRAFPGERREGMAWNCVCWCILTTFRIHKFMVTVCWFF